MIDPGRMLSQALSDASPDLMRHLLGTVINSLLSAGVTWADLRLVELNEAFAVQSLACLRQWPDLDPGIVNRFGGAIAIGHPLGASGARVVGALARRLRAAGGGWGLATLCIGVGQGLAVVLEA